MGLLWYFDSFRLDHHPHPHHPPSLCVLHHAALMCQCWLNAEESIFAWLVGVGGGGPLGPLTHQEPELRLVLWPSHHHHPLSLLLLYHHHRYHRFDPKPCVRERRRREGVWSMECYHWLLLVNDGRGGGSRV